MPDIGKADREYSGERQNTAEVYYFEEERLWYAKVGPDRKGRFLMATGQTPVDALEGLLMAIMCGEYQFDPERLPK